jgi:branched-chain amino acid transport system permease protein
MRRTKDFLIPIVLVALATMLPLVLGSYPLAVARTVLIYMALAISWDILLRSGQISFGIAGIFGLGAYAGILATLRGSMPPMLSILVAGLVAALVAFMLGFVILRLRATYFSITTMALGEIFRVIMHNGGDFTGGAEGVVLPAPIFKGDPKLLYWLALGVVVFACVCSLIFQKTRLRLALTAIRNNEVSAKSSGIHIFKYLMIAFVVSSFIQGLTGGIQAQSLGFVTPESVFDGNYTLLPLAMALLGGTYSTPGPILGALLLGIAAEYLKLAIPYGHLIVYGIIIIVVILFMPQGLWGIVKGKRRAKSSEPPAAAQVKEADHA